jgi:hypothetical protein
MQPRLPLGDMVNRRVNRDLVSSDWSTSALPSKVVGRITDKRARSRLAAPHRSLISDPAQRLRSYALGDTMASQMQGLADRLSGLKAPPITGSDGTVTGD